MIVSTPEQRIMQRSKLVDTLHFLTAPTYNGLDMSTCTLLLEYKLPVSQETHSEILTLSNDLYNKNLEYKLPLDTSITISILVKAIHCLCTGIPTIENSRSCHIFIKLIHFFVMYNFKKLQLILLFLVKHLVVIHIQNLRLLIFRLLYLPMVEMHLLLTS